MRILIMFWAVATLIGTPSLSSARSYDPDEPEFVSEPLASDSLKDRICLEVVSLLESEQDYPVVCGELDYRVTAKWRTTRGFVYRLQIEVDIEGTTMGRMAGVNRCTATARWQNRDGDRYWSVSADECE